MKCCENRTNWYNGTSDNTMQLKLYMTVKKTEVLGPYKRYAIWVQGCNKRCIGCISPDAQALDGGYSINVDDLVADILSVPNIEGITISGGEPFLQQHALCNLVYKLRGYRDIGIIVYTGMKYDEIKNTDFAKMVDIIIDGEYIEELNDDKSLRGSSNQNVICVSDRYKTLVPKYYGGQGRKIELSFSNKSVQMIGIPSKNTMNWIGE